MHKIKQFVQFNGIYFTALLLSILLSIWKNLHNALINPDAICYLQSAQSMPMGIHAAMNLCDQAHWPFYAGFIYAISVVTQLTVLHSAYLLDGLFSAISVLAFMRIAHFFKDSKRVLIFAAVTILLAHDFNSLRESIIRDHGFWAFYLVSILALLRFVRDPRALNALSWSASLFLATLFRLEGVIFLIILPFVAVFSMARPFRAFCLLHALLLTLLLGLGIFIWVVHSDLTIFQFSRLAELKFQWVGGFDAIVHRFMSSAEVLSDQALNRYSSHDKYLILFLTLVSWYVIEVVKSLSLIYTALVIYAWCKKLLLPEKKFTQILWSYILLNMVVTGIFLVENNFLSKRYILALSLTLMIWVPFALDYLYEYKKKIILSLVLSILSISLLGDIVHFGPSKKYIREAGLWLEKEIPLNATVYSNDYQVMYYSQRFGNTIFTTAREFLAPKSLAEKRWKQYDYLAWRFNKVDEVKNRELKKEFGTPVKVFSNSRGDEVAIYKIINREVL